MVSILATAGSLADSLTSQITQLVIDILSALVHVGSLLDVSCQHCSVDLDFLNHVLHHALDHIVDLVDVLDLSLCDHWHVDTWLGVRCWTRPVNDWTSHSRDAARSACVCCQSSRIWLQLVTMRRPNQPLPGRSSRLL